MGILGVRYADVRGAKRPEIGGRRVRWSLTARPVDTNRKARPAGPRRTRMSNYLVGMEAAWLVRDVGGIDDAIGVAVSSAGRRLNEKDLDYVEVDIGGTQCPYCGEDFDSGYIAADTALVGLVLEMKVFNADSREHAQRIAKSEIGGALRNVPLKVLETFELDGEED